MLPPMSDQADIQAFLDRTDPALLGVVGTVSADGSPHIVPVWYRHDGSAVHIWSHNDRNWVQNLSREPRAAFSVQEMEYPFSAVVIKGRAKIVTGDDESITAEIWRICRRYIEDEAEIEAYIQRWSELRTIVTITPEKTMAWAEGY